MDENTMTKPWSPIVAPAAAGAVAGVRLQDALRRVAVLAPTSPITGQAFEAFEAAAVGHRRWSPPIT